MELGQMFFGPIPEGEHEIDRETYTDSMCELFMYPVFDHNYGERLETDVVKITPFDYNGEDESPNFIYKPTGLKIWWYKYPFRSSYSNVPMPPLEEWVKILDHCRESAKGTQDGSTL